jgi:mono/diheme cytochrome c family protein
MKIILVIAIAAGSMLSGQTLQQTEAGRTVYQARCSSCHAPDLGGNEAPQLSGSNFMSSWGNRTARELITHIHVSMPPANQPSRCNRAPAFQQGLLPEEAPLDREASPSLAK